jgi:hypothetical protein
VMTIMHVQMTLV